MQSTSRSPDRSSARSLALVERSTAPEPPAGSLTSSPEWPERFPLLADILDPSDVRRLDRSQLQQLATEVRAFLIESVTRTGGHLGAGLGVVELTVALFAELDLAHDRLVWDVGHQCYPHKALTGRAHRFDTLRFGGGLSGFPDPAESIYDAVKTGHGGTSISTALGFALAWHARDEHQRTAVAVIGDGSLQEGNAFEALNHAGTFHELGLVVILNDNGMAISPAVGALNEALRRRRHGLAVPPAESPAEASVKDVDRGFFEELGFEVHGPVDGHDIDAVREAFARARQRRRPVLLHVVTRKGAGFRDHEPEHTCYHAVSGAPARPPLEYPGQGGPSFTHAFADIAIEMAESDERIVAITAAMLEGTGLHKMHKRLPGRCLDVGMSEQHAVALAAGLALAGQRPICAIYSTFLQRAYDQVFQEVALQKAKVLFVLDRGGLVGADGATHNGMFDIGFLRCLPNFALMSPRDTGELRQMMALAFDWNGPVAIRIPRGSGRHPETQLPHAEFGFGDAERLADGDDGCLLAYGPSVYTALEVRRRVGIATGRRLAVINARFAKPLDATLIEDELRRQPILFTLEDHSTACGFGSAVAELVATELRGTVDANRLRLLGVPDRFVDHGDRTEQLAETGLDADAITREVIWAGVGRN